ncbi:MAG: hypothetical protein IKT50_02835 [Clostridia bacterium]|nr:hypothetical protein [Clostridia bacterium]
MGLFDIFKKKKSMKKHTLFFLSKEFAVAKNVSSWYNVAKSAGHKINSYAAVFSLVLTNS